MRRDSTSQPMMLETVRRHRPKYQIALYMGLLLMLGLVVMYAIGPQRANMLNYSYGSNYSENYFFNKQLVSVVLSVFVFAVFALVPYQIFTKKYANHIFVLGMAACFLLVLAGQVFKAPFATETNGAYRWFQLGILGSFQPSELLKFGSLTFLAGFLGLRAKQGKINDVQDTLLPLALAMGTALIIVVVFQKDLGTGVSLLAIILSMLVVAGMDGKLLSKILLGLVAVVVLFIISAPHRMERVATFMQGDNNSQISNDEEGHHIRQARIAIGSGGLFGLGIGKSVQVTGYLPEAATDSVFAIMGETFGFVGLVAILGLFVALLMTVIRVASRLPEMQHRLVAVGVFGLVGSHVLLNIAAMTGVAPLTGISLPLLSQGGTSMLFIGAALGLVFQLSRYTSHKPLTEGGESGQDIGSQRRVGRTRYASSRGI